MVGSLGRQWPLLSPTEEDLNQTKNLLLVEELDAEEDEERRVSLANSFNAENVNYGATHSSPDRYSTRPGDTAPLTTYQPDISTSEEIKFLITRSIPLAITFFLQYSLNMASLFSVGHLGKIELGAVSLGAMTVSVTGIAYIQGISTCLDTLCCQAFGAGRPDLVGLYFQKGVLVSFMGLLPVMMIWYRADLVLPYIVTGTDDETEVLIMLATKYMRIMMLGMPAFTIFECGKRFLQAQGIFHATTIILVFCAPVNIILNYYLVWCPKIGLGFIGAPIAVSLTYVLMVVCLFLYVVFVDGKQCWNGFTRKVFKHWGPLVQLAIPGLIMVESEFLGYEVMTLASSYLGTNELAVQTIMSSITSLSFEVPFALGCVTSARVANYLGTGLPNAGEMVARYGVYVGICLSLLDSMLILLFRYQLVSLFSNDPDLIKYCAKLIPLAAIMHGLDATSAVLSGILRGQGRQKIGGYINIAGYYLVGLPIGLFLCFGPEKMGLVGIWLGIIFALVFVMSASFVAVRSSDWEKYAQVARSRT